MLRRSLTGPPSLLTGGVSQSHLSSKAYFQYIFYSTAFFVIPNLPPSLSHTHFSVLTPVHRKYGGHRDILKDTKRTQPAELKMGELLHDEWLGFTNKLMAFLKGKEKERDCYRLKGTCQPNAMGRVYLDLGSNEHSNKAF